MLHLRDGCGRTPPGLACPTRRSPLPDVLDQSEIDALLAAVETGEVEEERSETPVFSRKRRDFDNIEIKRYDFKRPERVSKDQMRALQTLHEAFARNFGAALSGFLRTIVELKVVSCEQMTYSEFISGLPNPTSYNLLSAPPLEGAMCLEISPLIIYPVIDRLLGGTNQELFIPQRPLTTIEERLIHRLLDKGLASLNDAWASLKKVEFTLSGSESNPQLVQIVPPNEVVIVIGFEVKMTNRAGTMNLCIPYNVIEPVVSELSRQSWFSSAQAGMREKFAGRLARHLGSAPVGVSVRLAETSITLRDLLSLSVGDIVMTEKPATEPVVLCVEEQKKFLAHIGQHKGQRAVRVLRAVNDRDRC